MTTCSDDGYDGSTRNRLTSIQTFQDDERRVVEMEHIDPHAVVSIGDRRPFRLNMLCALILWSILTNMWLVTKVGAETWAFSDHETGVFNRDSSNVLNRNGWMAYSDHETGAFNRYSSIDDGSGRENCVFNILY